MRRVVLMIGVFGALAVACQWIVGVERLDKPHSPSDDASVKDPCVHVVPPPPPDRDDDPSLALTPFVLAVSTVEFSSGADGFDLDGVCSCDKRPGAAHDGGQSCRGTPPCDADGGIDDALSSLSSFQFVRTVDDALGLNANIASGNSTILLLVSGYNGRANDKEVSVGFVLSEGIADGSGCPDAGPSSPTNGLFPPAWCGSDIWTVQKDLVFESKPPYTPTLNTTGYVTNHRLVIPGSDKFVRLLIGATEAQFNSPTFVGTLTPLNADLTPRDPSTPATSAADRYYRIDDGVFTGRLDDISLLTVLGGVVLQRNSYVCMSNLFGDLKKQVCGARDVAASPSLDFDPSAACSAMSVAFRLTALPALPGDALEPRVPTNPCLPGPAAVAGLDALYQCGN